MPRCHSCGEPLSPDRDRHGARCPYCRESLFEDPRGFERRSRTTDGLCALHAQNPALGTCQRCGNFVCWVCRTRWRNQSLCTACVERALEAKEAAPGEARTHLLQAVASVLLGVAAWIIALVAVVFAAVLAMGSMEPVLAALAGLGLMGSALPALLGVGQGAAAIRARGNHMILATIGLILSSVYVGAMIGLFGFVVWQI